MEYWSVGVLESDAYQDKKISFSIQAHHSLRAGGQYSMTPVLQVAGSA